MSNYIVNTILFQLLFLGVFEIVYKKETFFNVNRFYLMGSFVLSLVIPLVKIPGIFTNSSVNLNTVVVQRLDEIALSVNSLKEVKETSDFTALEIILGVGMLISTILFVYKIYKIYQLKKKGTSVSMGKYTKVVLPNTDMVFSFLNTIYIGERAIENSGDIILNHEIIHIDQKHTFDLLFFELLRIVFWFNPMVYIYQSRISEIHEYISDHLMSSEAKKAKYELLLNQIFKTQNISFVNSFYKKSLIKKRIIMLQKDYSDKRKMLNYILLIPIIASMLMYSSCSEEKITNPNESQTTSEKKSNLILAGKENIVADYIYIANSSEALNNFKASDYANYFKENPNEDKFVLGVMYVPKQGEDNGIKEYASTFTLTPENIDELLPIVEYSIKNIGKNTNKNIAKISFSNIDKVPVFPGCENSEDLRSCFMEKVNEHIRKYFKYPEQAQLNNIQGRVFVQFTIKSDGTIQNIRTRGPEKILEDAARKILEKLPKMTPGEKDGVKVDVPFSIPISYKLQ